MSLNIFDLMKKTATLFFFLLLFFANGQRRNIPVDTIVVTNHTTTIKNQVIKYQAQAGKSLSTGLMKEPYLNANETN